MVNLLSQHKKLDKELQVAIWQVIESSSFIKGREVAQFEQALAAYLQVGHVTGCANGTDDAGLAPWRCQKLPTAEQQHPEHDLLAFADLENH